MVYTNSIIYVISFFQCKILSNIFSIGTLCCRTLYMDKLIFRYRFVWGFPGSSIVKNLPASMGDTGDMGLISGLGRSLGGGNSSLVQDPHLENPTDRRAWWATVQCSKEPKQLGDWVHTHRFVYKDTNIMNNVYNVHYEQFQVFLFLKGNFDLILFWPYLLILKIILK